MQKQLTNDFSVQESAAQKERQVEVIQILERDGPKNRKNFKVKKFQHQ